MRKNTAITLVASLGFGVLAVTLARGWINDAVVKQQQQNQSATATFNFKPAQTTPVLVADVDLEFGDILTADMLRLVDYPDDIAPAGTFSQMSELFNDNSKVITVLEATRRNEPILDFKLTGQNSGPSLASLISEGYRAVSVRVDAVSGVGGFVMPEDRVDVIFIHDNDAKSRSISLVSDILLQNVRVLGIDQSMKNSEKKPNVVRTVTLEVKQNEAQKLQLAMDAGKLSLTLRPAGDVSIASPVSITKSALTKQQPNANRAVRKPKIMRVPTAPAPQKKARQSQIIVIRGDQRNEVTVKRDETAATSLAGG